jgi:hypothetical protein
MKVTLAQALIERGILANNSRIIAKCPVTAMGDMPTEMDIVLTVDKFVVEDGTIKFHSVHKSGRRYSVPCEEIKVIDGMAPERLAAAYDIKPNGKLKPAGKKRGRKSKEDLANA